MTNIRVDPPVLQNCSQTIQSSSATLKTVGGDITSCASGAPSYDGQFGPRVREIAAGASSLADQLSSKFSGLAAWISNKAQQFLNADNTSSAAVSSQYNNLSWMQWLLLGGIFPPFYFVSFLSRYFPNGINLRNWLTGNLTASTIPSDPFTDKPTVPTVILQTKPTGSEKVLTVTRWETLTKHEEYFGITKITNIGSHIAAYGCLMTAFTMVLNDMGSNVYVTDLYKANYNLKPGNDFDIDVDNTSDRHIVLFDLNANDKMVNDADQNFEAYSDKFASGASLENRLNSAIEDKGGTIIVQANIAKDNPDGHWIVINMNEDGSYSVRDPMEGPLNFKDFTEFQKKYTLTESYKYIDKTPIGNLPFTL